MEEMCPPPDKKNGSLECGTTEETNVWINF